MNNANLPLKDKLDYENNKKKVWILFACVMTLPAILFVMQRYTGGKVFEKLSSITPEEIVAIDCLSVPENDLIVTFEQDDDVSAIVQMLRNLEGWRPQQPRFSRGYDLILHLENGKEIRLECMNIEGDNTTYVYIYSDFSYGSFKAKSRDLNIWLRSYIKRMNGNTGEVGRDMPQK